MPVLHFQLLLSESLIFFPESLVQDFSSNLQRILLLGLLFILIFINVISCTQKEKVLDEKSRKEVYGEIIKDIENMKAFKYTN